METDLSLSRPIAAAARLRDLAPDHHRFVDKRVLLTGEASVLASTNGRYCLLNCLRLLVRTSPNLTVFLPTENELFLEECRELAELIAFGGEVVFARETPDYVEFHAILSLGTQTRADLPWTVINSNGWLARVSSGATPLPPGIDQANPIGALAAACLGVTEVFKRLILLKESRGRLVDGLAFSLFSYRCGETEPGPAIPVSLLLDLLLIGVGAIGNGVVLLLSQLPVSGRIAIVDKQSFGKENLGTCILIGPDDLEQPKAEIAEKLLAGKLQAVGFHETLEGFESRLGVEVPFPKMIVTALDDIDPRHRAQGFWPDVIIDGAIGAFPAQVSRHRFGEDSACMACLFRHPPGPSANEISSRATGLRASRIADAESVVTDADVEAAPIEHQGFLRERLGKPVCSVVQEGIAKEISQVEQKAGFSPSAPFVASFSASMMVAELVKEVAGWGSALQARYQLDLLRGPMSGLMLPQEKRSDCGCVTRAKNIEKWRLNR
jgi:molybdopterin/thiamine biosynthesis adenylyltransferase